MVTSLDKDDAERSGRTASGGGGDRPAADPEWVLLQHRLPREPSAPRIALWRAVRRLGATLLGDGLVALPASPRNIEHVEWLAAGIEEQAGEAMTWIARPRTRAASARLVAESRNSVEAEYRTVIDAADAVGVAAPQAERRRTMRRLRGELRRIDARDYFGAPSAAAAREAVDALAQEAAGPTIRTRSRDRCGAAATR